MKYLKNRAVMRIKEKKFEILLKAKFNDIYFKKTMTETLVTTPKLLEVGIVERVRK